jgi:hypothetical protein
MTVAEWYRRIEAATPRAREAGLVVELNSDARDPARIILRARRGGP